MQGGGIGGLQVDWHDRLEWKKNLRIVGRSPDWTICGPKASKVSARAATPGHCNDAQTCQCQRQA